MNLSSLPIRTQIALRAALIIALGAWVYSPVFHGGWLDDDDAAITENADVHQLTGLWSIWFKLDNEDYFPLKDSVQWLQWQFFGGHTLGYHLTNLGLQLFSAMLIWRLLARWGVRAAWLGGLLFTVHPLMVESVAWISELKNTLSLPLLLLAMHFYLDFDESRLFRPYLRAMVFFMAAMLCKTSVVMFPFVILLYAWWRRGRIGRQDLRASAAFFGISLVLGLVTVWFQQSRVIQPDAMLTIGFFPRLTNAALIIAFYLAKFVFPVELVPMYPRWEAEALEPWGFFLWLLIGLLCYGFWLKRFSWGRHALFGFGFFLINLVPVLGFISMAWLGLSWVSDHLAYLPLIGLIGMTAAGFGALHERLAVLRPGLVGAAAVLVALLAWDSHGYTRIFHDRETLGIYTLRYNPESWQNHDSLGSAFSAEGRDGEAIEQFEEALRIKPTAWIAHDYLARIYQREGKIPEAIGEFQEVLRIDPNAWLAHDNLGLILANKGQFEEALDEYREALRIRPQDDSTQVDIGNALAGMGRNDEALSHFREAVRINPGNKVAHGDMGVMLTETGQMSAGIQEYQEALRLDPNYAEARYNLGIALGQTGDMQEAVDQFQKAAQLEPNEPEIRFNWAVALTQTGRIGEAIEQYQEALRLNPHYEAARTNLIRLQGNGGG